MRSLLFYLLLVPVLLSAQSRYATKTDIPYYDAAKTSDSYLNERCRLDVHYPTEARPIATIIWFHGGGLTGGNKEIPEFLKNKGFAVVGVGYRLSPNVKVAQIIEDAAAAIAWTFEHCGEFNGAAADRIFLSGHSAGGYLDLMVGLNKTYLSKYGIDADRIAGIIPLSPQVITHFTARKEMGIPEKQPLIDQWAPLYHVRGVAPPILLITGDRELEMLGRYDENAYMARMMKIAGHPNTRLMELDGFDHVGMVYPALPLLVKEVERIIELKVHPR